MTTPAILTVVGCVSGVVDVPNCPFNPAHHCAHPHIVHTSKPLPLPFDLAQNMAPLWCPLRDRPALVRLKEAT